MNFLHFLKISDTFRVMITSDILWNRLIRNVRTSIKIDREDLQDYKMI